MVKSNGSEDVAARTMERKQRKLRNPRIGFIGKPEITPEEASIIQYIGRGIALLGHTTVIVPAKGASDSIRKGIKEEGGKLDEIKTGIIEKADHTIVYANNHLLERIRKRYPDIDLRKDVVIIFEDEINDFLAATKEVLREHGLEIPS